MIIGHKGNKKLGDARTQPPICCTGTRGSVSQRASAFPYKGEKHIYPPAARNCQKATAAAAATLSESTPCDMGIRTT